MKKLLLCMIAVAAINHSLTAQTIKLFDGKTTNGWHAYNKTGPGPWAVVDKTLQLDPGADGQADLVTDKEYENFELTLSWRISARGNSGIILSVHEDPSLSETYLTGIEMQILDDQEAEDNKKASHLAGALYDMRAPSSAAKPACEWNK